MRWASETGEGRREHGYARPAGRLPLSSSSGIAGAAEDSREEVPMDKFGIGGFGPKPQASSGGKAVKALLAVVGLVGAIVAGIYTSMTTSDWALVIYAFVMVSYLVGRGLGDILTEPFKVKRTLYFGIPALTATGVLYVTHAWWDRWWLAVLLGLLVGGVLIGGVLATVLFPGIAKEEAEDTAERTRRQFDL
jgi:hypothetical protein